MAGDRGIATTSRLKVKEEDESCCVVPPFIKRHKHETTFQDSDLRKSPDSVLPKIEDSVLPKIEECLEDAFAAGHDYVDLMLAKARELCRLAKEDPDYFKRHAGRVAEYQIYGHLLGEVRDDDDDDDEDEDEDEDE